MAAVAEKAGPGRDIFPKRVLLGEILRGGIESTPQLVPDLLYEGRVHVVAGLTGKGKTLLALWMALRVIEKDRPVVYLDAENGPGLVAGRLGDMDADPDTLDRLFHYHRADLTLKPSSLASFRSTVAEADPALVVFDSLADLMGAAGLDESSNPDCTRWFSTVVQPLRDVGVSVLVLDHFGKSGRGPRGGSSKVAALDVLWNLEVAKAFDRARTGQIRLSCREKDREGWLPTTVTFSVGGGVFARSAGTIEEPGPGGTDGLSDNAKKVHEAMKAGGGEGARHKDLLLAVGGSKGNLSRALEELKRYRLFTKSGKRYRAVETVPQKPAGKPDSPGARRYQNGTAVPNGTGGSGGVPGGTAPSKGGTSGTSDAPNHEEDLGNEVIEDEQQVFELARRFFGGEELQ